MHHGPFPSGLAMPELSRQRIHYLSGGAEGSDASATHGFTERDAILARANEYEEVVLWFEHDLLDQLQILQLLDYFSSAELDDQDISNLSIICINRFPGIEGFRGLGQLNPEQLSSLYPSREKVTREQIQQGARCWSIFRESGPLALQELIKEEVPGLFFVNPTLLRHCQEYPWLQDGLTRTERQLLHLVANGEEQPGQLFVKNMEQEDWLYIGDARTYSIVEVLCNNGNALLQTRNQSSFLHPYHTKASNEEFHEQRLVLTDFGRKVLAGDVDARDVIIRDEWLGGVHLESANTLWFWNEPEQVFVVA